jgi:hypothetical protein
MKLIKTVTRESSSVYTEYTDGSNTFIYEDDVLVRVETLSFTAIISNSDNSLIELFGCNDELYWSQDKG